MPLPRPCPECARPTTGKLCQACYRRRFNLYDDDSEHVLTDGRWELRGGLQRWVPDDPAVIAARARQRRLRVLLVERYETGGWWSRRGRLYDDSEHVTSARLAELLDADMPTEAAS